MNKPTRITPNEPTEAVAPDQGCTAAKPSLLERLSGDFSLDHVRPRGVPETVIQQNAPRMPRAPLSPQEETAAPLEADEPIKPRDRRSQQTGAGVALPHEAVPVARDRLRRLGLIDPDLGTGRLVEEFRIVKRQLLASAEAEADAKSRRILVTSPLPGDGKTFCATNLAITLAGERDLEVVLVDADFGKPSIMDQFGLGEREGLMDVLRSPMARVEDHVVKTDINGLYLLSAGKRSGSDAEYLASERTWEVLNRLTRGAPRRFIVFDSPPALAASPAAELAKHVGQVLLVARADRTARAALEDACDLLSGCDDIRLLLNDATFNATGRSFGQYYGTAR